MLAKRKPLKTLVLSCLLSVLTASCHSTPTLSSQTLLFFRSQANPNNANLTIDVESTTKLGEYSISGTTDLPKGTKLTVMALRYLHVKQAPLPIDQPKLTYSILAYDTVKVGDNRYWQTRLSLWKITSDGQFKEAWQLHKPDLKLIVEPEDNVVFLATLAPTDDLEEIERELAGDNQQFSSRLIQTTSEGSRYLQAGELLTVDLPTGESVPPAIEPDDINGGWGNRFLELPDLPNTRQLEFPEHRQTNAPLSSEELLY